MTASGKRDEMRRLDQQRELAHGSGAPRSLAGMMPRLTSNASAGRARSWSEMPLPERVASSFVLLLFFAVVAFGAWLTVDRAGADGVVVIVALLALCAGGILVGRRIGNP